MGAEPGGAREQSGGLAPDRRDVVVDAAVGVERIAQLERLPLAEVAERVGEQGRGLPAHAGGQLGRACQDVVAGQHGVVYALDRVDGRLPASGEGTVEDVVVDERADLYQLDRGRGRDDPIVEHVTHRGGDDREKGAQPLPAGRGHAGGGGGEHGAAGVEGVDDPLVDSREPVAQIGDAEEACQIVDRQLWPGLHRRPRAEVGHLIERRGVHGLASGHKGWTPLSERFERMLKSRRLARGSRRRGCVGPRRCSRRPGSHATLAAMSESAASPSTPTRIGVVGCGLMGSGVAEVAARAGLHVVVVEADEAASKAGRGRIESSLSTGVDRGKLEAADMDAALGRIAYATDPDQLADRELVIEAVVEDEATKVAVFERVDRAVESADAILASNTSSIPIMKLAMATRRPEAVVGMHFFNPVPVLALVELVPSLLTGEPTIERSERFATEVLGKRVIRSQDRAGFVVNALLIPYLLSAIRMLESGFATADDIDAGMVEGCAHPMGPLRLTDLIGLDTTMAVAESLYEEFKEPLYAAPPLLSRMVDAGLLGRKTGRGFYDYHR